MSPAVARFLLPWTYLVHSRLKARMEQVSWVLINPVVVTAIAAYVTVLSPGPFIGALALAFIAWQSVYETGYLENDLVTTQREAAPTLRLASELHSAATRSYWILITGKLCVAGLACIGLVALGGSEPEDGLAVGRFIGLLIASRLAFYAHNSVRSRLNVVTYLGLAGLKYGTIPALFYTGTEWWAFGAVVVLPFPLLRTLEHARKDKYHLSIASRLIQDVDRFRPMYYGGLAVVFTVLLAVAGTSLFRLGLEVAVYLFLLRLVGLALALRMGRRSLTSWGEPRSHS